MTLALLCDEHIPYPVIEGLERRGVNVTTIQQIGMNGIQNQDAASPATNGGSF